MKTLASVALAVLVVGCRSTPPAPMVGSKPIDAVAVGTISGIVKIDGNPKIAKLPGDPYCSPQHKDPLLAETYVIGEGRTLGNVLVHVTVGHDRSNWAAPEGQPVLDQVCCVYTPHAMVVRLGQTLHIVTQAATIHNVNCRAKFNPRMNKACTKEITLEWKPENPEIGCSFTCQIHPWTQAFVHVLDHPLYAVTAADGKFTLNGVPPGDYELTAWHEKLGTMKANVTVCAREAKAQDFTFVYKK